MKDFINNFTTSGINFSEDEEYIKARYKTLNIGLVITMIALVYGIIGNLIRDIEGLILVESILIFMDIALILALRKFHNALEYIVLIMISQFTFLFIFLIYIYDTSSMKFTWIFTYPMILIYLHDTRKSAYWMISFISMLLLAPFNPYIDTSFTLYQLSYISVVLVVINSIIYFYQVKMKESQNKILQQKELLYDFNLELENKVLQKTQELQEINESLEIKVNEKIEELRAKDKILEVQSKQAVMGEMISMIAHQWRQPLSTITLQIANIQFKRLLGKNLSIDEMDKALKEISDTIMYLSDTVDDFQTYFHPDKEMVEVEVDELLNRAVNFTSSRIKNSAININVCENCSYTIKTYPNEFVQVILNILNNAIDAHNEKTQVNARIEIDVKMKNNDFIIEISDNAGGIKPSDLNQLFEPYFSTKGKNGTGLGLYMSQMIVQKQFYGHLSVSNSDVGAVFKITLPRL